MTALRPLTVDDVPQMARIRAASYPWFAASVAAQENWFRVVHPQAQALRVCAERDGRIVAFGVAGLNPTSSEEGAAELTIAVDPTHRGQGLGTALLTRLEEHIAGIGGRRIRTFSVDTPRDAAFALRHGYSQGARDRYSKIDTTVLPPMPPVPDGVTFAGLREVGPEVCYELDMLSAVDEPGDVAYGGMPYDIWLRRYWESPDQVHDVGTVALVGGVAASVSFMEADLATGRGASTGAGTLREYRGRGLAKLTKSVLLRKAAAAGIHTAITCNDYENKPMLAINDWLGYEVFAAEWSCLKTIA